MPAFLPLCNDLCSKPAFCHLPRPCIALQMTCLLKHMGGMPLYYAKGGMSPHLLLCACPQELGRVGMMDLAEDGNLSPEVTQGNLIGSLQKLGCNL